MYSPHSAVDATLGGVNDWLADGISGGKGNEESREVLVPVTGVEGFEGAGMGRLVTLKEAASVGTLVDRVKEYLGMKQCEFATHDSSANLLIQLGACSNGSGGCKTQGSRRVSICFLFPPPIASLFLIWLKTAHATPPTYSIRKIGLCAGSGGSMFKGLDADLYLTGELSHHEALAAKESGISVITCTSRPPPSIIAKVLTGP